MKHISETLENAIRETIDAGQQVMLFINRRGHSPNVHCPKCGWVASCPDCSCGLSYHKKENILLCHVCGRKMALPKKCPDCGADVTFMGAGIEKIEEEIKQTFPSARTCLVSSDTTSNVGTLEKIIDDMESGKIDIVIGTQILAKGHHFPNLTLVGVIDADAELYRTDFRAAEKTFQQLFQVAGRAGRGKTPGRVLLQTCQPDHPVIKALQKCERDEFVNWDMKNREAAKMPPFGQLIAVIVEHANEKILIDYCHALAAAAPKITGGKILGPIPAEMYRVRNWFRMRFLVTGGEVAALQPVVKAWLDKVKQPSAIRIKIDVAPQNFM